MLEYAALPMDDSNPDTGSCSLDVRVMYGF
jgi:hypothetical protein